MEERRMDMQDKTSIKKAKNTVLELNRSATQRKDVSNNNESNKQNNTNVISRTINDGAKETMASVDISNKQICYQCKGL